MKLPLSAVLLSLLFFSIPFNSYADWSVKCSAELQEINALHAETVDVDTEEVQQKAEAGIESTKNRFSKQYGVPADDIKAYSKPLTEDGHTYKISYYLFKSHQFEQNFHAQYTLQEWERTSAMDNSKKVKVRLSVDRKRNGKFQFKNQIWNGKNYSSQSHQDSFEVKDPSWSIDHIAQWNDKKGLTLVSSVSCEDVNTHYDMQQEWFTDYDTASKIAQEQNKSILLLFNNDENCPTCFGLKKRVWSQLSFLNEVKGKAVLVYVNFPSDTEKADEKEKALHDHFQLEVLPTLLLLKPDGTQKNILKGLKPLNYQTVMDRLKQAL